MLYPAHDIQPTQPLFTRGVWLCAVEMAPESNSAKIGRRD